MIVTKKKNEFNNIDHWQVSNSNLSAHQSLDNTTDSTPTSPLLALNSKPLSLNNPFLHSLVCTNSCQFSGPLTLLTVFDLIVIHFHIVHLRQCL